VSGISPVRFEAAVYSIETGWASIRARRRGRADADPGPCGDAGRRRWARWPSHHWWTSSACCS